MKKQIAGLAARLGTTVLFCALASGSALAQKAKPKPAAAKAKPIIFAVINDGTTVEPIASIDNGKLVAAGSDSGDANSILSKTYYRVGAKYDLIFGAKSNGTVAVTKSNVGTECGGASATVGVASTRTKLKGFVMGLATNTSAGKGSGVRRTPTAAERTEIEALVRAEYAKEKVPAAAYKTLHYHNLTAVDVDNDGTVELIGSYWVAPKTNERGMLFFIAEKGASGKYAFAYHQYESFTPDKVMSGEMKDLDGGIYQTLLIDLMDINGDGVAEVFTLSQAFEGNNYTVLERQNGTWTKALETYDYRCGY
jgi:hypothetical protein